MDLMNGVDRIEPDHEAELSAPLACPGGSGSNTTLAITRLGARAAIVGAVADDRYGHLLRQDLATAGIDTVLLRTVPGSASTCRPCLATGTGTDGLAGHRLVDRVRW
jgi:ribokinase